MKKTVTLVTAGWQYANGEVVLAGRFAEDGEVGIIGKVSQDGTTTIVATAAGDFIFFGESPVGHCWL